mgnify:CR=1 FL=1
MKKCYATLLLAALCSTATLAQQQDSLITQPAAGETINLYRTTTGYESVYYYAVDHQSTGDWQRMVFGEIGLSGEVRAVSMAGQRVQEAKKLGFETVILPEVNP